MKVVPTQNGEAAAPRIADTRIENADKSAFKAVLAQASTTAPGTDVAADPADSLRKGEKMEPVKDHKYAEITAGKRSGMFINTSGNVRDGEAFVLVRKNGKEYHIYGSGADRLVVGFHMPATATTPEAPATGGAGTGGADTKPADVDTKGLHLRKGETIEPVKGHAYAEIVSGARNGMFVNTSGNERHGETFVLARKHGVEYHIYGTGANREVVAMRPRDRDDDK